MGVPKNGAKPSVKSSGSKRYTRTWRPAPRPPARPRTAAPRVRCRPCPGHLHERRRLGRQNPGPLPRQNWRKSRGNNLNTVAFRLAGNPCRTWPVRSAASGKIFHQAQIPGLTCLNVQRLALSQNRWNARGDPFTVPSPLRARCGFADFWRIAAPRGSDSAIVVQTTPLHASGSPVDELPARHRGVEQPTTNTAFEPDQQGLPRRKTPFRETVKRQKRISTP